MPVDCTYLPYADTGSFSPLVIDYLSARQNLRPFYTFGTDREGLAAALAAREQFPIDRQALTEVLRDQYKGLTVSEAVRNHIDLLEHPDTFTVCTAHQPNLLTGYLYFIYKIVHAIKLAKTMMELFPGKYFVPVYYMGSEDNDLDELGTFRYNGKRYVWDAAGQTGAVGRMKTGSLKPLLEELQQQLGPPGKRLDELSEIIRRAYLDHATIAGATRFLVNELFGRYGLVILDPDERRLKAKFVTVMRDDLLTHRPFELATQQTDKLSQDYKTQAFPRPVNLFYLNGLIRERIEQTSDRWRVINTDIEWTQSTLMLELEQYPERFSPNVVLRGAYQETILPNVAFIGGGAEVAYWLQLKPLFDHYGIFYPSLHLRQSVLWIDQRSGNIQKKLGLSVPDLFKAETDLVHDYINRNGGGSWQVGNELAAIEDTMTRLKQKAVTLDPTLKASAEAALARIRHQLDVLGKKMLRAEKRRMKDQLDRISGLKARLFPGAGLQERVENFLQYYLDYGPGWLDLIHDNLNPLQHRFMVLEEGV